MIRTSVMKTVKKVTKIFIIKFKWYYFANVLLQSKSNSIVIVNIFFDTYFDYFIHATRTLIAFYPSTSILKETFL